MSLHSAKDPRGREKKIVTRDDFVCEPDETMKTLAHIKNNENLSWRQLADEYVDGVSHALVRKVTLGICRSRKVDEALGIRRTDVYTLAFRFKDRADFERARAAVDAHPGGRAQWLLDRVEEVSDDEL